MRFEYQLTNGDVAEADLALTGKRDRQWGSFVKHYVIGLVIIAYFVAIRDRVPGWRIGQDGLWWLAIGVAGWTIFLTGLRVTVGAAQRASELGEPWLDVLEVVEVGDDMLVETDGAERTEYTWGAFEGWKETANLIVLPLVRQGAVALPKRAMDGDQLAELRALLTRRIGTTGTMPERAIATPSIGPGRRSLECNYDEFREAIRFLQNTPAVRRRRRLNTVFVVTCFGVMAVLQFRSVMRGTFIQRTIMLSGVVVLGAIIGLFVWWSKRKLLKLSWLAYEAQRGRRSFGVVPEGLVIGETDWRNVIPWKVFVGFWETANLFLLPRSATDPDLASDPSKADVIIIPKRVFETASEAEEFRRVLEGNLDKGDGRGFEVLPTRQRPVHVDSLEGREHI